MMSKNDYRRRVSRRRRSRFSRHLPTFIVLFVLTVLIGGCIFAVSRFLFHKKSGPPKDTEVIASASAGTAPDAEVTQPTEPALDEVDRLIAQADRLAAGYDYDGAVALVESDSAASSDPRGQEAINGYLATKDTMVEADHTQITHVFFHTLIMDTAKAFDGDADSKGYNSVMTTADEFKRILNAMYERGYVLVRLHDVAYEEPDENGNLRFVYGKIMLPEGKKPLILSYDDTNYYEYMLANGFTYKLVIGEDGKIASWGKDPQGNEVTSRDLDAIPILDKFVEEHLDFSPFGAKGCLSLTGYQGILGYRTQTDQDVEWTAEREANRQKEIEAVKPIIAELKRTGWTFGSHTWGHIRLGTKSLESIQADTQRWFDEVGSLVGPTTILFYPHGERPDGNDWQNTGPVFQYLQSQGFRVFASVGIESFSYIKKDLCAVICDRLHPDGTTLRHSRDRYLQFYDAKDIMDVTVRPQREIDWA